MTDDPVMTCELAESLSMELHVYYVNKCLLFFARDNSSIIELTVYGTCCKFVVIHNSTRDVYSFELSL